MKTRFGLVATALVIGAAATAFTPQSAKAISIGPGAKSLKQDDKKDIGHAIFDEKFDKKSNLSVLGISNKKLTLNVSAEDTGSKKGFDVKEKVFDNPGKGKDKDKEKRQNGGSKNKGLDGPDMVLAGKLKNIDIGDFLKMKFKDKQFGKPHPRDCVSNVPLPATLPLLGAALVGLGLVGRRKRSA